MIVLSFLPPQNSYPKAKMSHHTTPSHKRDTVICLLSTSPNCISLVDVQSTTKINPSPAAISKLPSTATTSKKKEPHPPKTKSQRRIKLRQTETETRMSTNRGSLNVTIESKRKKITGSLSRLYCPSGL